jgi:hypothetical protein
LKAIALLIVAIQMGLDLHAVGTIKAGHGFGFVAGLLIGLGVLVAAKRTRLGECPNRP